MNWPLFFRYLVDAVFSIKYRLISLLAVVVVLLGLYLVLEAPRYKTSWVMLLPGTERASTINLDNIGEARSNGGNAYGSVSISPKNTYKEIALSDAVINSAAKEYGVAANAFSKPRIKLIDQTPAMQFTLVGESKEELAFRANLFNKTFLTVLDQLRNNEIERNFKGVEFNLEEAKKRLRKARQDIVDYQIKTSFISDDQFTRWTNDTEQLRAEHTTTEVELASINATLSATLAQLGISAEQARALLTLQANPAVVATLKSLSEKLAESATISAMYAAQNPNRKSLDREVESLTKEVRRLLNGVPNLKQLENTHLYGLVSKSNEQSVRFANSLLAKQSGLIAQGVALMENRESYLARVKNHARDAATLADLQRVHQIAEAIFSSALAKLDTSRLDIYATYPLTQLLTQPGATIKRDRLQTKLMILASVLIYGMLSLALALVQVRKRVVSDASKLSNMGASDPLRFRSFSLPNELAR